MNLKQKILKAFYPLLMKWQRATGRQKIRYNQHEVHPAAPVYDLTVQLNNGTVLPLEKLRGKKILLVNTASNCGYTAQYAELQKLYEQAGGSLEIIALPSNDFKQQEKDDDTRIGQFCTLNFGIRFPLAKKIHVRKGPAQDPLYRWLSSKELNGWNDRDPAWNFSKFLISENGMLTHIFDPAIAPLGKEMKAALETPPKK